MGTGAPGGDYAIFGPTWGELAAAQASINIAYRATGGAAANILLIEQGVTALGLSSVAIACQARMGAAAWTAGVKFRAFRALLPLYPSILQIVSPASTGITSVQALAGEVIGIGPEGSSAASTAHAILASIGVQPKTLVTGGYTRQLHDMLTGQISACAFIGAPPLPAIAQIALTHNLSLIGLSALAAARVAQALPGMRPMVLKAGLFPGQRISVGSVGTANIAIGAASLPKDLATAVTEAALTHMGQLAAAVGAPPRPCPIRDVTGAGVTFHPGAAVALRNAGFPVPDEFVET
jgi:TRAP transporter TAXI family solute receptor